jgi:hypothetical protein
LGTEGLEPSRHIESTDFKSVVSTIPPRPRKRRYPDSNWRMKDLQSIALPLGDTAFEMVLLMMNIVHQL